MRVFRTDNFKGRCHECAERARCGCRDVRCQCGGECGRSLQAYMGMNCLLAFNLYLASTT